MKVMWDNGEVLDEVTLSPTIVPPAGFTEQQVREEVGRIIMHTPSAAGIETYCKRVKADALSRALEAMTTRAWVELEKSDPEKVMAALRASMDKVESRMGGVNDQPRDLQEIADALIEDAISGPAIPYSGLPCGIASGELDRLVDGFGRKQLIVLSAGTGAGKSTACDAIVRGIRKCNPNAGEPLLFSTEMAVEAVARKALASVTGIWTRNIKRRQLSDLDKSNLLSVRNTRKLAGVKTMFVHGWLPSQIELVAKQHKRRAGLPVMVVDLAEELGGPKDERERIEFVMSELARMKVSLDTCIIACVQQNRAVKDNAGGEAELHNLKGSSAWEEGADLAVFLHRPSARDPDNPDKRTKVSVKKNREDGELGSTYIKYDRFRGEFKECIGEAV